jgi:Family of unknown function (DUF6338)
MNNLITPENFAFFARNLLAGWIIILLRSRFVRGEQPKLAEMIAEAVVLSLINQLFFALIRYGATFLPTKVTLTLPPQVIFFTEVLVLPLVLGILFGLNLSRGWGRSWLRRLSMPVQNPVRRAYDFAFEDETDPGFLILTFVDGTVVYGLFGDKSMASTDPARSEIYLERLYDVKEDGQWIEKTPPRGALLSLAGIRSIEFLEMEIVTT